jgi:hypothetical protein
MKKIFFVLILTLALNFLFAVAGIGWLIQTDHLNKQKISAIKEILFPRPAATQPATQPVNVATTQPARRLEEMLAKYSGRPPVEQLEYIRKSFDAQMQELNSAAAELAKREEQVNLAQKKVILEREALREQATKLAVREQQIDKVVADKGFQDSLALYQSLPAKQVKGIFMGLEDHVVIQYLQAMESRTASKIIKEYKSPDESERLKRIIERMRQATTQPVQQASVKE